MEPPGPPSDDQDRTRSPESDRTLPLDSDRTIRSDSQTMPVGDGASARELPISPTAIGNYTILGKLGEGWEAETPGRLKHPGIGATYESGRTEEGQHFFAMELVRGATLDIHVAENAPPYPTASRTFVPCATRSVTRINVA